MVIEKAELVQVFTQTLVQGTARIKKDKEAEEEDMQKRVKLERSEVLYSSFFPIYS